MFFLNAYAVLVVYCLRFYGVYSVVFSRSFKRGRIIVMRKAGAVLQVIANWLEATLVAVSEMLN